MTYDKPKITSSWKRGKVCYELISFGKTDSGQDKYGHIVYLNGSDKRGAIYLKNWKYRNKLIDTLNWVNDETTFESLVNLSNSVLGNCHRKIEQFHEVSHKAKPFKFGVNLHGTDKSVKFYTDKQYTAKKIRTLLEAWQNMVPLKKLVTLAEMVD